MKIIIQLVIILFFTNACSHNLSVAKTTSSCYDKFQKIEIFYKKEDLFYTKTKYGFGRVAFMTSQKEIYLLDFVDSEVVLKNWTVC